MASNLTDECRVPQGFVFALDKSSKLFNTSPLSNVIMQSGGFKHLQIYHSVSGGQVISAQDPNNNLRFLEWQTQEIKRSLLDVKTYVPELQSHIKRWGTVVDDMRITVIRARRLLTSASDWSQLKAMVAKLDDGLDTMTKAFDLLLAQLQLYRNQTNILSCMDRFIRLKADLPKTVALSFMTSSIQRNFVGLRVTLVAKICHERLCFPNMKSSIWSLHSKECGTSPSKKQVGLLVEGASIRFVNLSSFVTLPEGGALKMVLPLDNKDMVTTFESVVNLFGLKSNAIIRMTGNELSFVVGGVIFGEFDAILKVKADLKQVVNWDSVVFEVEGTMVKSSRLYIRLENEIANKTMLVAREARRRLANAKTSFYNAKRKADLARAVLNSKQVAVEHFKNEERRAANELREALLQYNLAKVRFNSTLHSLETVRNSVCEIKQCNYTCLNGCVIPALCQNPINVTYLEEKCDSVEKPMTLKVVNAKTETRSYTVQKFKTVISGDCLGGPSFDKVKKFADTGRKIGMEIGSLFNDTFIKKIFGTAGYILGGIVGLFSKQIFGCSEIRKRVPDKPQVYEYDHKTFEEGTVTQLVREFKCTSHIEKAKPGRYGPPYKCCKQYGCQSKVIDPQCIIDNENCLVSLTKLKFKLGAMNATLVTEYQSLRNHVDKVQKAMFSYDKARVLHEIAVIRFRQVEAHMRQLLSAVEITNSSILHIRQMVNLGLKIAQALNASDNKKIIDVGKMHFALSMASGSNRKIVIQTNASLVGGQRTPVSFLVDFDQVERSVSWASKIIIAKLFPNVRPRQKRSTPEDSANSTQHLHSTFLDYRYACLFVNSTYIYLNNVLHSLTELISSVRELDRNLTTGSHELKSLSQTMNIMWNTMWNTSFQNAKNVPPNSSFLTRYLEMIELLKDENTKLSNDSFQFWNDTLEVWRAFLEVFTSAKGFAECSGTQDCIDYLLEEVNELYEFENSPRAHEIKVAFPQLRKVLKSLTTEALTMLEAEKAISHAVSLLKITRDNSVLCGGTPRITSSSPREIILLPGYSLSLNCSAEKEVGLEYVWKRNDVIIAKAATGTFSVNGVTKANEGAYVCVVSNNKGSTVSNTTIVKVNSKPKITQHPQPQKVVFESDMPATFICNATAEPSPTFQWFFQSSNSAAVKINETESVLYIAKPRLHQDGYYYCEAYNKHGVVVSQRARLNVLNYTVGLPRLLVTFNLTTRCWLAWNTTRSVPQYPLPCESMPKNILTSSIDKTLAFNLLHSLARSLNLSIKLISELRGYNSGYTSKSSIVFVINIDKESWKAETLTSYLKIAQAISDAEANMLDKLIRFNSDVFNKTFIVPWSSTSLLVDPGSLTVLPWPPQCRKGQTLANNGFICGKLRF